jgi:hypothetical protein
VRWRMRLASITIMATPRITRRDIEALTRR